MSSSERVPLTPARHPDRLQPLRVQAPRRGPRSPSSAPRPRTPGCPPTVADGSPIQALPGAEAVRAGLADGPSRRGPV